MHNQILSFKFSFRSKLLYPKQQILFNIPNPIPQHSRFFKLQIPGRLLHSFFQFRDFFNCVFIVVNLADFNLIFTFQTAFNISNQPNVTISICSILLPKKRSPMVRKRSGMSLT